MPKMINLDRDTYGLLTVQSTYMKVEVSGRKQKYCSCICECKKQSRSASWLSQKW